MKKYKNYLVGHPIMVKGLKQTSSLIVIGARVVESAPNTFTQASVDLQLNPLDNEVFVVQAINLDAAAPDAIAATDTGVRMALTTTSQATFPTLASTNCMALASREIRAAGYVDGGVGFEQTSMETPPSGLSYIGIISTNDFFLQILGGANASAKIGNAKVYGYRARADAAVYAALVQSEVLSSWGDYITPEQNKLLGQLLTAGVPLPIALPIAMDPQAAQAGITDGIALFEQGADAVLNVIPNLAKKTKRRSRAARASDKKLSQAFKEANRRYRNKDGSLRAGRTQADIATLAHKLKKKM